MPYTEFYGETDWECTSGPIVTRDFDASADLWPHGSPKDVLEDGLHPVLAIGPKAERPRNLTGVVISYNSVNDRAQLNLADKVAVKAYVSNATAYSASVASAWDQSLAIGEPVYVDDSADLAAGVTLSRSPLNASDVPNPLAGYLFYSQTEYADNYIGGAAASRAWPITITTDDATTYTLVCVMLVNDFGTGNADLDPAQ